MIDKLSDRSHSFGHHRWLDFRFHSNSELHSVHIVCGAVDSVNYRMAVGIQREDTSSLTPLPVTVLARFFRSWCLYSHSQPCRPGCRRIAAALSRQREVSAS